MLFRLGLFLAPKPPVQGRTTTTETSFPLRDLRAMLSPVGLFLAPKPRCSRKDLTDQFLVVPLTNCGFRLF
jgi:hypothetical protein